jgi:two-component system, sensor histidine kinase
VITEPSDSTDGIWRRLRKAGAGLSLRRRFLIILLLASLPGMIVAIALAANALHNEREQIEDNAKRLADIQAAQLTNVIENARTMMQTVVELVELRPINETECTHFLSDWTDRYPSFTSLTLIDSEGTILCANQEPELPTGFPSDRFLETIRASEELVVGEYTVGQSGLPLIIAALPIRQYGQHFAGAIAVGIDLRWLEFLARRMHLPTGSTITAIGGRGEVLTHYRAEGVGNDDLEAPRESVPVTDLRDEMTALGSGALRGTTMAGSERVFGFQRTDSGNLTIAVGMPQYLEFERYGAALRDTLAAPMAILILALLAAGYASQALVIRWVHRLTGAANKMADGNLDARSGVPHSRYELGRLAAAFDSMAASIQDKQRQIWAKAEQYKDLLLELNHRVNNNMQMMGSLIRMKARGIQDREARLVIQDIEQRLRALTDIQRLLHDYDDSDGDTTDYPVRLGRFLEEFYSSERIKVRVDAEPIPLPRSSAIPLALIMNELITNACKHAYPEGEGEVRVKLSTHGDRVLLSVADDGVPMPEELEQELRQGSMGQRIIRNMTAQLGGQIDKRPAAKGKSINVEFPLEAAGQ